MQQLGLNGRIGAHRERQAPIWARQPSGALDQSPSAVAEADERPPGGTLLGGVSLLLICGHRELAIEIVRHDGREQPRLVGGAASAGDLIHASRGLCGIRGRCRSRHQGRQWRPRPKGPLRKQMIFVEADHVERYTQPIMGRSLRASECRGQYGVCFSASGRFSIEHLSHCHFIE